METLNSVTPVENLITVKTFLPIFSGLYGSNFEDEGYNELDYINSLRSENNLESLDYDDLTFDYENYRKELAIELCGSFHNLMIETFPKLITEVKCEGMVSPKYYNYSNDSINIEITVNIDIFEQLIKDNFDKIAEKIKEKYTSCSGFISRYSNDINEFLTGRYGEHQLGSLLNILCEISDIDEHNLFSDIQTSLSVTDFDHECTKVKCDVCGEWYSQKDFIEQFNNILEGEKKLYFDLNGYYPKETKTFDQWINQNPELSHCN